MCGCGGKAIASPEEIQAAQLAADERREQLIEEQKTDPQNWASARAALANASS